MYALGRAAGQLEELGATLILITPQEPEHSRGMIEQHSLHVDILWDHNNELAKQFGLAFDLSEDLIEVYRNFGLDLPGDQGVDGWTLPMPGRFVIDSGGVIRSVDSDPDYTSRPEPQTTVDFVATL